MYISRKNSKVIAIAFLVSSLFMLSFAPYTSVLAVGTLEFWTITNQSGTNNYQGSAGDTLKITGQNLAQGSVVVNFGSVKVVPTRRTNTSMYITVPNVPGDQTYQVSVTNGTITTNSQDFYVKISGTQPAPTPTPTPTPTPVPSTALEFWTITNQSGTNNYQGSAGDTLKITGQNLAQGSVVVNFGSVKVVPTRRTNTSMYITVPNVPGDQTYQVSVTNGTITTNSQDFYVKL